LSRRPWLMRGAVWGAVFPAIAGVLAVVALIVIGREWAPAAWLLMGGAALTSLYGWRHLAARGGEVTLVCGVMAAILLSWGLFGVVAPRLRALFPSATLVGLTEASGCVERHVVTSSTYQEPSLVFLAGTSTRATDVPGAVAFLRGGPCRFALVSAADTDRFAEQAQLEGLGYQSAGQVDGINYSNGNAVTLTVYWSGHAR
jgi:hypothetical protein